MLGIFYWCRSTQPTLNCAFSLSAAYAKHARGKVVQYIINCDSQPTDTRFTTALIGFNCDDVFVIHLLDLFVEVLTVS